MDRHHLQNHRKQQEQIHVSVVVLSDPLIREQAFDIVICNEDDSRYNEHQFYQ